MVGSVPARRLADAVTHADDDGEGDERQGEDHSESPGVGEGGVDESSGSRPHAVATGDERQRPGPSGR